MKLPNFTADSPDLFFLLMEAALTQQGITSNDQKFLYTLMQCPQRVQIQAKNLINSTANNKMDQLKAIVDNLYALPVEQRLKTGKPRRGRVCTWGRAWGAMVVHIVGQQSRDRSAHVTLGAGYSPLPASCLCCATATG